MPKILIVEDNEMNRDLLSRRLERERLGCGWHAGSGLDVGGVVLIAVLEHR